MLIIGLVVILYLSLVIELTCFHVPSVANTQVFFNTDELTVNKYSKYRYVFYWSMNKKVILLLIPHLVNMTIFILPLYSIVVENTSYSLLSITGIVVASAGRFITFYSMYFIRNNNSQTNNDFTLHVSGPFSKMRNPGLTGMLLFFLGLTLIWPTIVMVLALVYYFFYNHLRILIEEDFLRVMYREKYDQYLKKVNRYI